MSNLVEVPEEKRQGFAFGSLDDPEREIRGEWAEWAVFHRRLGQELAKRMREYPGPTTEDDIPPPGGTPVLMRMAA